jgi:transcriptional regulator with XRE-family HTH domain
MQEALFKRLFYSLNRSESGQREGMADGGEKLSDIGERIRILREALRYDNASLFAAYVGWSPQQLSNYEKGVKRPEVSMAIRLCKKTGVTLDWIYRGETAGLPLHVANVIQDFLDQRPSATTTRA